MGSGVPEVAVAAACEEAGGGGVEGVAEVAGAAGVGGGVFVDVEEVEVVVVASLGD